MSELVALLDVQRLDNTLDQLRYKHEHLEERAALAELDAEIATLDAERAQIEAAREELRKQERTIEGDAGDVKAKAESLEVRLYDGSVTSPKEASTLADEIKSLKSRQSGLEDQAIEILVEIEPLDEQLVQAEAVRGEKEAKRAELARMIDELTSGLDSDIATAEQERIAAVEGVTEANLDLYRKLRITYGPRAVVKFDPAHHGGCPVAMSAVELDRWKHLPVGSLDLCVDCGRLVAKVD